MSDIEDWLRSHEADLAEIAEISDLEPGLVHLTAVLVLAGIDDAQIYDQLHGLVVSLNGQRHPFAGTSRALEEIVSSRPAHDPGS